MLGMTAPRYILFHLRLVKGPDLEQALLVLTLDAIRQVGLGVGGRGWGWGFGGGKGSLKGEPPQTLTGQTPHPTN
jgi:hypothetical protein